MNSKQPKINKGRPEIAAHVGTYDIVLNILKKSGPGKVLDVGAGSGHFAKKVSQLFNQLVYAVELKKDFITKSGLQVAEVDLNKDPLPYPDNFFDYATFIEVIEHLKNPWFVLKEINRVLKPGGKLILTTPNICSIRAKRWFVFKNKFPLFEKEVYDPSDHVHPFTLIELKLILKENNFLIEKILYGQGYNFKVPWSFYKKYKSRRFFMRNLMGYVFRNFNYLINSLISFFLLGKFSTKNRFFSLTTIIVASKKNESQKT